jgi:hypothetical protein
MQESAPLSNVIMKYVLLARAAQAILPWLTILTLSLASSGAAAAPGDAQPPGAPPAEPSVAAESQSISAAQAEQPAPEPEPEPPVSIEPAPLAAEPPASEPDMQPVGEEPVQPAPEAPAKPDSKKKGRQPKPAKAHTLYVIPGPAFGVNPVYGVMLGVGATASYYFGDPKTTRQSNILFNLSATTTGQFFNTYKSFVYTKENAWILIGDWRYMNAAEPTFGLGTGPDSAKLVTSGEDIVYNDEIYRGPDAESQLLAFEHVRFHETVFRRVFPDLYLGMGYHLDVHEDIQDGLLDLDEGIITSHYAYSELLGFDPTESFLSGLSLNVLYDSRDSPIGTYTGTYAHLAFRLNSAFLGSSQDSSVLTAEARHYLNLSPKNMGRDVLAGWLMGSFTTSGAVPYLDLFATAYDQFAKSGRGYVQGRFRGEHYMFAEAEYRRHLFDIGPIPLNGTLFFNLQTAGVSRDGVKLFDYIEPAGGAGLRVVLQKATRLSIALDYGVGNYGSTAFYVRMNDTF